MSRLWLVCLPLIFLPNLGYATATPFGVLELSDYVVVLYLLVLVFCRRVRYRSVASTLRPLLLGFVAWAFFVTFLINVRYRYDDAFMIQFALLKLAKLSMYTLAGAATVSALRGVRNRQQYLWSLLAAGVVSAGSLIATGNSSTASKAAVLEGFKTTNAISVLLSILGCYLAVLWLSGHGSTKWRGATVLTLGLILAGSATSSGRGGWLGGIAGILYVLYRGGFKWKSVVLLGVLALGIAFSYVRLPEFRKRVEKTLNPDFIFLTKYHVGIKGLDDGGRFSILLLSLPSVIDSPLLGRGFYNRGEEAGISKTGSHNFFLQMFLETGIVGGFMVLAIFFRLWRQAGAPASQRATLEIPLRAALLAAIVGGLSGEYFYGGVVLFSLFAVYAPVGALRLGRERAPSAVPHRLFRRKPRVQAVSQIAASPFNITLLD